MKIGLILLPMWTVEVPPLGISALAAVLRKEGHDVRCIDANLIAYRELGPALWDLRNARGWAITGEFRGRILPQFSEALTVLANQIVADGFEAVGFTTYGSNYHTISWFSTLLKFLKPEMRIAIGGPEIMHHHLHRLANFQRQGVIDATVLGEGEVSATALFNAWGRGDPIVGIPGVAATVNGKIEFSGRPPALDINGMMPPDFSDFELGSYTTPYLPVQFSRGCSANCTFCNEKTFYWPTFQMKGGNGILEQIEHLIEKYDTRRFWATDSLVNGNHAKLADFVDLVIGRKLQFHWGGNMRIDKRLREPLNKKLREAGCERVCFGVESGSNSVLKAMRKGITREDTLLVLRWMREAGITVVVNFMVGFPGESDRDFEDTLRLLDEAGDCIESANTSIFVVDLTTEVGRNPKKFGILMDKDGQVVKVESTTYLENSWLSESGDSTPEIRLARLLRLRDQLGSAVIQSALG